MIHAALYARVSSTRQKQQETIDSQTACLREHAQARGWEIPEKWVFTDDGWSGASLVRPALERLRDLSAQRLVERVVCLSPDRLARNYAHQVLLVEEFTRNGTELVFIHNPVATTPEQALMVQFQGMIAEYERAQIAERTRRGKLHRARSGATSVLGRSPWDRSTSAPLDDSLSLHPRGRRGRPAQFTGTAGSLSADNKAGLVL
ncbi:recombinase family protein [Streptomyces mirabilis]|uniref:recombinase family protein n=1 Tax=Streptomyces mirabilis TaxID=68239 RepID=UPI0037B31344